MAGRHEPLENALGHRFVQPDLLQLALTHSSTVRAPSVRSLSNQRLEFLGDRVLGLVVAQLLYEQFPGEDEGALARRSVALVRREALADIAREIDLAPHVIMSPGEEEAGGRANPGLLADTLEAVIAALYLDGGLGVVEAFIRDRWQRLVDADLTPPMDAKTTLQEWAQARGLALPLYEEVGREGPAHAPVFRVRVSLEGYGSATASGSSKRAAEQGAAEALLNRLLVENAGIEP